MKDVLNIIVAGELDCGKSTLIGRLSFDTHSLSKEIEQNIRQAKDPQFAHILDSLQEERQGQYTLDTTQAFIKSRKRQYVFIDVPGHKELLKNMLSGSSHAEAAIVVVDVQKGLEEQTKRHLYILKFLGIEPIILAINKMDLVSYKKEAFQQVSVNIGTFLKEIRISHLSFIPVSAKGGECLLRRSQDMPWYKGDCLIKALDTCARQVRSYDFRFPVQDIYKINNKRIIVGNVLSGKINTKDTVRILPSGKELKVKNIKVFNKRLKSWAKAPEGIGIELDTTDGIYRGHVLYKGTTPRSTSLISAKIFCIMPFGMQEKLTLYCSTQKTFARISRIKTVIETTDFNIRKDLKALKATDAAEITITLDKPICTEDFKKLPQLGRFILVKDPEICAIGITL